MIAFITNRSLIDSKTFDGFRKCVDREFGYVYIVDTQSDVRNNPKMVQKTMSLGFKLVLL